MSQHSVLAPVTILPNCQSLPPSPIQIPEALRSALLKRKASDLGFEAASLAPEAHRDARLLLEETGCSYAVCLIVPGPAFLRIESGDLHSSGVAINRRATIELGSNVLDGLTANRISAV
jgi:hypothetical protein